MATKKTAAKKSLSRKSRLRKKSAKKKSTAKKPAIKKSFRTRSTLTFLTESLPGFTVGRNQKTRVQAIGGALPYSFAITQGTLPAGLNFNYKGTLWGRPTQAGDTTIFVKVIDFVGSHLTQAFDLQVN